MKKYLYHGIVFSLLTLTLLSGCSGGKSGGNPPAATHVYVAGNKLVAAPGIPFPVTNAVYWEDNGDPKPLDSSTVSTANAIAGSNGIVYIAGSRGIQNDQEAGYWYGASGGSLNFHQLGLSGGMTAAMATAIAVSGAAVHTAGAQLNNSGSAATYWKSDGTPVVLDNGSVSSQVFSIAVSGGFVYAVGVADSNGNSIAMYWKIEAGSGTVDQSLELGSAGSFANSIAISSDGTIYVAGSQSGNAALCWKINAGGADNSTVTDTFTLDGGVDAFDVAAVSGNVVYVAGRNSSDLPMRWKIAGSDVTQQQLSVSAGFSGRPPYVIAASSADVYVAGALSDGFSISAVYWKNDEEPVTLSTGAIQVSAIFVDRR